MSVVEGLRNIGKLNVQTKGYDFASYTHHICSNEKVFLKRQKLEISPKKTNIFKITQPIKFLGFSFQLTNSGKVTKRILPSNIKAQRRKIKKLYKRVLEGKMTIEKFEECYQSWRAFVKKTDSRGRMLKMDKFKNKLKGELLCQMSNTLQQLNKPLSH